ncbi:MAG TPA: hypothetical protein DEP66_06040, partial [Acidimicrobiaceae bacterium]|nr:hypothetical protein [Acidimicrobiaceae bacterium]
MMSGRPQRFGTVVARRQGDLVPAPVDGSVDEDERTRLGVATLAARRADLRAKNEAAARARAAEP